MSASRPRRILTTITGIIILASGCHFTPHRPLPFIPPNAEPLAPVDDPCDNIAGPPSMAMASPADVGPYDLAASDACAMRRPRNVIAFSGGGAFGAYSA